MVLYSTNFFFISTQCYWRKLRFHFILFLTNLVLNLYKILSAGCRSNDKNTIILTSAGWSGTLYRFWEEKLELKIHLEYLQNLPKIFSIVEGIQIIFYRPQHIFTVFWNKIFCTLCWFQTFHEIYFQDYSRALQSDIY